MVLVSFLLQNGHICIIFHYFTAEATLYPISILLLYTSKYKSIFSVKSIIQDIFAKSFSIVALMGSEYPFENKQVRTFISEENLKFPQKAVKLNSYQTHITTPNSPNRSHPTCLKIQLRSVYMDCCSIESMKQSVSKVT